MESLLFFVAYKQTDAALFILFKIYEEYMPIKPQYELLPISGVDALQVG